MVLLGEEEGEEGIEPNDEVFWRALQNLEKSWVYPASWSEQLNISCVSFLHKNKKWGKQLDPFSKTDYLNCSFSLNTVMSIGIKNSKLAGLPSLSKHILSLTVPVG